MRLCAHSNQGADNGLNRKSDGLTVNAAVDDIAAAKNTDFMKSVRLSMLANEWHPACSRCQIESDAGHWSRNQAETDLWSSEFTKDDAIAATALDGTIDLAKVPSLYYDIRFGNKCNIKCRSCNPTESNFWYEDYVALWGWKNYRESFGKVTLVRNEQGKLEPTPNQYEWYESANFWNYVNANSDSISRVHMVGGEPTLIEEQYSFLRKCIDKGISKNITIEYNTNLVKLPPKVWDLWKEFKQVCIGASIDGVGPVNDYIRHPSKWKMIADNLSRIDSHPDINFNIWIAHTVMSYNIWYLPDTLEYILRQKYNRISWLDDNNPLMTAHPLYRPVYFSIQALPPAAKRVISNHLDKRKAELLVLADQIYTDDHIKRNFVKVGINKHLTNWRDFMNKKDIPDQMDMFWQVTNRLDQIRNESMEGSLPELYDVLMREVI